MPHTVWLCACLVHNCCMPPLPIPPHLSVPKSRTTSRSPLPFFCGKRVDSWKYINTTFGIFICPSFANRLFVNCNFSGEGKGELHCRFGRLLDAYLCTHRVGGASVVDVQNRASPTIDSVMCKKFLQKPSSWPLLLLLSSSFNSSPPRTLCCPSPLPHLSPAYSHLSPSSIQLPILNPTLLFPSISGRHTHALLLQGTLCVPVCHVIDCH